jgi:adenine-specific DNA-methyltransferase
LSRPRHDIFHPVTGKSCKKPSTGWRWDEEKTKWALSQVPPRIHFGPDEGTIPTRKSYLAEIDSEPFPSVFYRDGRSATLEVEKLFGDGVFQFPKNRDVLQELISLTTGQDAIVLDFFAGSGTTGHAVMAQNALDGGNRRYILVQMAELLDTDQKDQRAAAQFCKQIKKPQNIAEITKERLRRAGKKVKADTPLFAHDVGFRVYKLDTSNIRPWGPDRDNLIDSIQYYTDHIVEGRTEDDILTELLLKLGLDLCVPIEKKTITGKTVHSVGGVLLVCLAERITAKEAEPLAHGIADWHQSFEAAGESVVVFRDSAFDGDDVTKTNLTAILTQRGLGHVRSL